MDGEGGEVGARFIFPTLPLTPQATASFSRRRKDGEGNHIWGHRRGRGRGTVTAPWNLHNSGLQKMTAFSVDAQFIPGVLF